jgi:hypothetical protein
MGRRCPKREKDGSEMLTPHAPTPPYTTRPYTTLLHPTPPYSTLLHPTPPYSTRLHPTPPDSTRLHPTPPDSRLPTPSSLCVLAPLHLCVPFFLLPFASLRLCAFAFPSFSSRVHGLRGSNPHCLKE